MKERQQHLYEFGPFCLDTRERVLLRDGRPLPLKPKVYETLLALISQSGHVVDKEELMRRVWPDVTVEENNLTGNIYALRRAFAEHQYIETVPRRGYRFTSDVKLVQIEDLKVDTSGGETEVLITQTISRSRPAINSLAVLPFVNAGADPEAEYLSDGITESIINNLSRLPQLHVMSRSGVFRYKGRESDPQEVGRELKVGAVLLGRVLQFSERLIIRTELVDVESGDQLWGEQYNRNPVDIFVVQEEIASEIFEKLRVRLTSEQRRRLGKRQTENPEAYQAYLKGRYNWNKRTEEGLKKSLQYFQQAVEIDPAYAPAYAGLADSYALQGIAEYGILPPREAMPRAKAAALRALEIDDTLAEAQTTVAHVRAFYDWDWPRAEQEFQQAIKLDPNYAFAHHWYALFLAAMGRHAEAIAEERRAQEIDPLSLIINKNVGTILYYAGQLDQSIEQYRKALELESDFARTHIYLGLAYERKGMFEKAINEYHEALRISGGGTVLSALLGHAHALSGNRADAMKIIDEMKEQSRRQYVPAFNVALIYAGLGENDLAFEWLDRAFEERSSWLVSLNVEPMLDSLRSDPRFTALLTAAVREGGEEQTFFIERRSTEVVVVEEIESDPGDHFERPLALPPMSSSRRRYYLAIAAICLLLTGLLTYLAVSRTTPRRKPNLALRSIAVLPFKSLDGGEGEDSYLGVGITDAVITRLGTLDEVKVRPTSAVLKFEMPTQDSLAAARSLGVDAVIEGRYQRHGERVRVTVQLVSVHDGMQLWSGTFDERFENLFGVLNSISAEISRELRSGLGEAERRAQTGRPSSNSDAYQAYLKGRYHWNKRTQDGLRQAETDFNQAIRLDPLFAPAHAGLADTYLLLCNYVGELSRQCYPRSKAAALEAVKLDPSLADPHATLAFINYRFERSWPEAEKSFRKTLELSPNHPMAHQWYGEYLGMLGRHEESIAELKLAQQLDPLSLIINTDLGAAYYVARQYDAAVEQLKKTIELEHSFPLAHLFLGMTYKQKGMFEEAVAELKQAVELSKGRTIMLAALGNVYGAAGRKSDALAMLRELDARAKIQNVPAFEMALVFVGLGEKDKALEWLEKSDEAQEYLFVYLKVDPNLDPLRTEPRFTALMKAMNFQRAPEDAGKAEWTINAGGPAWLNLYREWKAALEDLATTCVKC